MNTLVKEPGNKRRQPAPGSEPQPMRILLFEESPSHRSLLKTSLIGMSITGAEMTVVERLSEGLELLRRKSYEVALVDLDLPRGRGEEIVDSLRVRAPELPIIMLAGRHDDEIALDMLRRGVQDILLKEQLSSYQLTRALRYAMERHAAASGLYRRVRNLEASEAQIRQVIESNVDAMVVVNLEGKVQFANPAAMRMLGCALNRLPEQILAAPLGAHQALELNVLLEGGTSGIEEMKVAQIEWDGAWGRLAVFRDITARKTAEEELQIRESHLTERICGLSKTIQDLQRKSEDSENHADKLAHQSKRDGVP